jgi:hypothetical protein
MHRQLPNNAWFHKSEEKEELDPADYDIFMNPLLVAETEVMTPES